MALEYLLPTCVIANIVKAVSNRRGLSHLVDGQLVGVPLGDALDASIDDGDLDVGTLERHHAARGTPHVTGPDAANLGDNHCAFN